LLISSKLGKLSLFHVHAYFSKTYRRPMRFREEQFRSVEAPETLLRAGKERFGTEKQEFLSGSSAMEAAKSPKIFGYREANTLI
jgi:hypothetical protein